MRGDEGTEKKANRLQFIDVSYPLYIHIPR